MRHIRFQKEPFVAMFVSVLLLSSMFVSAQTILSPSEAASSTIATSTKIVKIASVNIYNAQIINQQGTAFDISFLLSNGDASEANVRYGIELLQGGQIIDEEVPPEAFSLAPNTQESKVVHYTAPAFLNGTYVVRVEARNGFGLPLGINDAGTITFEGKGDSIAIDPSSCFLTISNSTSTRPYSLSQGVGVTPSDTLLLHCQANNTSGAAMDVTPVFETHERTIFGTVVQLSSSTVRSLTIPGGAKNSIAIPLPIATSPGAYETVMNLGTAAGVISNDVIIHYVVHGELVALANFTLDKNAYRAGDIAYAQFAWSDEADNSPHARVLPTDRSALTARVRISDISGICAPDTTLPLNPSTTVMSFSVLMQRDCASPHVSIIVTDASGTELADSDLIFNGIASSSSNKNIDNAGKSPSLMLIALIFFIVIALIALIYFFYRKNRQATLVAILIIMGGSFVSDVRPSYADTFSLSYYAQSTGYVSGWGTFYYSVNLNKSTYAPGEAVVMSANAYTNSWNASIDSDIEGIVNGQDQWVFLSGTNGPSANYHVDRTSYSFTAPSTPGYYSANYRTRLFVDPASQTPPNVTWLIAIAGNQLVSWGDQSDFCWDPVWQVCESGDDCSYCPDPHQDWYSGWSSIGYTVVPTDQCPTPLAGAPGNGNGYNLYNGASHQKINAVGMNFCVSNSGGNNYFVPARSSAELTSFYNAAASGKVSGVSVFAP